MPGPRGGRLVALVCGSALALLLAELVLRIRPPAPLDVIRYPCVYEPDAELGFRYTPGARGRVAAHFEIDNTVEINRLGFYDAEPLPPGEASPRVLAVGDSFTAAMNVPRDAVWTAVLERALQAGGHPSADIVNLGLDGTGTDVHAALLRRFIPRLTPDLVLVAFYANDLMDVLNGRFTRECHRGYVLSYQTPAQRDVLRGRVDAHLARPFARWLFDHLYLVRLLHLADGRRDPFHIEFLQPSRKELGIAPAGRRARGAAKAVFAELAELSRRHDTRILLVPVPPRREPGASAAMLAGVPLHGVLEILDPLPSMERMRAADDRSHEDLYFRHDAHFDHEGNALFGRAVAERLLADPDAWRPPSEKQRREHLRGFGPRGGRGGA